MLHSVEYLQDTGLLLLSYSVVVDDVAFVMKYVVLTIHLAPSEMVQLLVWNDALLAPLEVTQLLVQETALLVPLDVIHLLAHDEGLLEPSVAVQEID